MHVRYVAHKFSINVIRCVFRGKGICRTIKTQPCPPVNKDSVQRSASVQTQVMVSDIMDAVVIFLSEGNPRVWSYLGLSLERCPSEVSGVS